MGRRRDAGWSTGRRAVERGRWRRSTPVRPSGRVGADCVRDARHDVVRPAVGQVGRAAAAAAGSSSARSPLLDEADLLAGRFADAVVGLQPVDLGGELAVHLLELVQLGLPLGQVVVLVAPRPIGRMNIAAPSTPTTASTNRPANSATFGRREMPLLDGDRSGEVAEARAALVGARPAGRPLDRGGL